MKIEILYFYFDGLSKPQTSDRAGSSGAAEWTARQK